MGPLIRIQGLHFAYHAGTERAVPALSGIDLEIQPGEYVAVVGANGSGKTTLARHLSALLVPTEGDVWIAGMNTREPAHRQAIRRTVATVLQNPDTQIVATVVEEDVAFGPENLGLPHEEIRRRVDWALEVTGLAALRKRSPHYLSGGQKQRLALAGAVAMRPRCLVLDEATAMLDPAGREAIHQVLGQLHAEGMTIIAITQDMEEVPLAERMLALAAGRVALDGPPRRLLAEPGTLRRLQLDLPAMACLADMLHARHGDFPAGVLTPAEMVAALRARLPGGAT